MRTPILTEKTGPSGPPIAIAWLMRLPPSRGMISHRKENFKAGKTAVRGGNRGRARLLQSDAVCAAGSGTHLPNGAGGERTLQ